jgi:hypothetical protein
MFNSQLDILKEQWFASQIEHFHQVNFQKRLEIYTSWNNITAAK